MNDQLHGFDNPVDVFTEEEYALAVALGREPSYVRRVFEDSERERPNIGGGVSMDTLVLMRLAAEELLRKVELFSPRLEALGFDERVDLLREGLLESRRIGRP